VRPSISLVVPVFNEEENLAHAVDVASRALVEFTSQYEIILVDDASTDRTAEIIRALTSADPHLHSIRHERNQKLGGTLRDGFAR